MEARPSYIVVENPDQDLRPDPGWPNLDAWAIAVGLWRLRWFVFGGTLLFVAGVYGVSLVLPKKYSALATIFVTPPTFASDLKPSAFSVEAYERLANSDYIQSRLLERLRERKVIGPLERPGRMTTVTYPSLEPLKPFLPLIGLQVEGPHPEKLQTAANTWASLFVEEQAKLSAVGKATAVDFIISEYPKASATLLERERLFKTIQDQQAAVLTAMQTRQGVSLKRFQLQSKESLLVSLEEELYKVRGDVADARQMVTELERELQRTAKSRSTTRAVSDDALLQSIAKPGDPASLASVKIENVEPNPIYEQLSGDLSRGRVRYNTLAPRALALEKQIAQVRADAAALRADLLNGQLALDNLQRQQKTELGSYQRGVDEAQAKFKKLEEKIGDAQIAKAERDSDVKIGALAEVPKGVSSPNPVKNAIIALPVGFCLSLLAAAIWTFRRILAASS